MPLQNRVTPFGELIATPARGSLFGNRGGRFHRDDRTLGRRRWASPQWICCVLRFKGRQRTVWRDGYTELFFLDEVTAFAAGHRPCFECRRAAAKSSPKNGRRRRAGHVPRAPAMDRVLQADGSMAAPSGCTVAVRELPDGAFVALDAGAYAVRGAELLRWSENGYTETDRAPARQLRMCSRRRASSAVLAAGYSPQWHPSAN